MLEWKKRECGLFAESQRWNNAGYNIELDAANGWYAEFLGMGSITLIEDVFLQQAIQACEEKEREGLADVKAWQCQNCGLLVLSSHDAKCPRCGQKA
jgi:uncharacterized paraquat-inducible protein A